MNLLPFPISLWLVAAPLLLTQSPLAQAASGSSPVQIAAEPRAIPYDQEMEIRRAAREQKEKEIRLGEKLLQQKLQRQQQNQNNIDKQVDQNPSSAPEINRHSPPPYSQPGDGQTGSRHTIPQPKVDPYAAQLPMVIGDNWVLKYNSRWGCSLYSSTKLMNDGIGLTSVSLVLTNYVWEIKTQSDIEPRHPENGVHLSNGRFIRVEQVVDATNATFPLRSNEITAGLQTAATLSIDLSFWPSWPMSDVRSAQISVTGFPTAYEKWQQCNRHFENR